MKPLILTLIAVAASGCAHSGSIRRDGPTYAVEVFASLQRQEAAATALLNAASAAAARGDRDACLSYARPALVIQAAAKPQAFRALWLAGLTYPTPDGSKPTGPQPDPGPAGQPASADTICGGSDER